MKTIRLYLHSMRILMKCQLQYPLSFAMQTLAQLIMEGGEMLAVILLIDRFDHLRQWEAGDLYFFFGIMSVTFYLAECFGSGVTGEFPTMVRSGRLDTVLLRPRGVLTQVLCSAIDPRRIACIAVGTTALIIGSRLSAIAWTPGKILLFVEAVGFGILLILGLFLIEAIFSIRSVKSIELVNAITYGGRSACEYPVSIYPRPLRILFTVLAPFALVLQVPAGYILGKPLWDLPLWMVFLSPLSGVITFAIIYLLFQHAMRFYRSSGS